MTSPVEVSFATKKSCATPANCTGLSKCGVKVSGLHVSGTDPLPLLTEKRWINETAWFFDLPEL